MAVTREQVLAAYAANPFAEARPSEEALNYWQNAGLGSFNQTVAAVRAENPALAAQIDTQRGNATPAVSNADVFAWFQANPNATDAEIVQAAATAGVSAQQLSEVTGVPVQQVIERASIAAPTVQLPAVPAVAPPSAPVARQITELIDLGNEDGFREITRTVYEPAPGAPTVKYNDGTEYDPRLIKQLALELTQQVGPLQGKVFDTKGESIGFNFSEAKKILGSDNVTAYDQVLLDAAAGLAKQGVTSLKDLQPQKITVMASGGEGPDYPEERTQIINKNTGQVVDANIGRTFTGKGNTSYSLVPDASGQIKLTTQENSSMDTLGKFALTAGAMYAGTALPGILGAGGLGLGATTTGALTGAATGALNAAANEQNILQGALGGAALGGVAGYAQGANTPAPGLVPQTDASFLAADAAQLASQGLSETAIAQTLGASGYASGPAANLAASMAVNGLDVGMMTQQLDALSTNTGLMSQTGSSADFLAADALQLQGQLGNNFPAIEQNLIASGVDPLIAADVSQQLAFNPNLTQTDLATSLSNSFGNNIYDVNMAQTYPTSVLPGAGGLLSDVAGAAGTTATTGASTGTPPASSTSGLTNTQIANLIKAGIGLLGTGAAAGAVGGGNNMPLQAPTQGMPTNTPEYYQQLQQYYNAYLPQTPRDVVSPLQQWYSQTYSGGNMQQPQQPSGTATGTMQTASAAPAAPMAPVTPATPTGLFTTGIGSSPARTGQAEQPYVYANGMFSKQTTANTATPRNSSLPQIEQDYQAFFDTTKPGSYTDFAGGVLYRAPIDTTVEYQGLPQQQDRAIFFTPDGREYTLTRKSNLSDIAYTVPEIAETWKQQYGFTPTGQAPASGVMSSDTWNPLRQAYADASRDRFATNKGMLFDPELRNIDLSGYQNNPQGAWTKLAQTLYGNKGMTLQDISRLQNAVGATGNYELGSNGLYYVTG